MQPLVHRLLHLSFRPERLASHRLFERFKDMKVTGEVWRVRRMWKSLGQNLHCCNSWTGSMGPNIVMLEQNTCTQTSTSFGLDCRTQVILQICIRRTGHSVPPGHVVLQNYSSFIPKESRHNLSRNSCVRNVLVRRYGAIPCSLSWFPAAGSGHVFHLP